MVGLSSAQRIFLKPVNCQGKRKGKAEGGESEKKRWNRDLIAFLTCFLFLPCSLAIPSFFPRFYVRI
jgi:hypothetical protein